MLFRQFCPEMCGFWKGFAESSEKCSEIELRSDISD